MHDFTGFTTVPTKEIMKEIVDTARQVLGEGFQDMDLGEIQELTDITPEELTKYYLVELNASELVPKGQEEDLEEMPRNKITLDSLTQGL